MKNIDEIGLQIPDLLLPNPSIDINKWAVVACDQFTSEPEYWEALEKHVGQAPSTLKMILPEVYLDTDKTQALIDKSQTTMREYLQQGVFTPFSGFILVERTLKTASETGSESARYGLIAALDLEQYDYSAESQSLIRATEGTIIERLPPRMKIRRGAPIELPHILVLIDDPKQTVIEPLAKKRDNFPVAYQAELFANGGHLKGYQIGTEADQIRVSEALRQLASPQTFRQKYQLSSDQYGVLLYAMGDGNHSLATAKAIWEEIKSEVGMNHPARYALVEIENIHSPALVFEPIHRILTGITGDFFEEFAQFESFKKTKFADMDALKTFVDTPVTSDQRFGVITPDAYFGVSVNNAAKNLPVGTLQNFLDQWGKTQGYKAIDYVHGTEVVERLAHEKGNLGFYLPAMEKSELFRTVILDGSLPRKTFSMGEAHEKRYYLECRKITGK